MKRAVVFLLLAVPLRLFAAEPFRAKHAVVVATSGIAARVGSDVMKKGGNAVDAAVAVALAEAVTWPAAGNLGGGGFMLIRMADGSEEFIDYRERAPLAATRTMYLDANGNVIKGMSTDGYRAVGVPGTVAGLVLAHKRHGKLPWATLVEPARKLAANGFPVSAYLAGVFRERDTLKKLEPWKESRRIFLREGRFFQPGERLVQPELAATLARIQKNPRDFYEGDLARRIAADMKAQGGLLTLEDLKRYTPTIRKPIHGMYRGHEIITSPPPSSGGTTILEALNILEAYDLHALGWLSPRMLHLFVEAERRAFADRAMLLGDPDFVTVPVSGLISRAYAEERRKSIDSEHASASSSIAPGNAAAYESDHTTHFAVVDPAGNIVSNTYTINDWFGAGIVAHGTGVLLNNEMDDFTSRPGVPNEYQLIQGEQNSIEPRKRPTSSMVPTIVLTGGKPWLVLGAAGGPRIISAVLQILIGVTDFGLNVQDAVDATRIHHQWQPDAIYYEKTLPAATRAALEAMGHKFRAAPNDNISDAPAVMIDPRSGDRYAAPDAHRDGGAAGW